MGPIAAVDTYGEERQLLPQLGSNHESSVAVTTNTKCVLLGGIIQYNLINLILVNSKYQLIQGKCQSPAQSIGLLT
jgi:hypothetical protein